MAERPNPETSLRVWQLERMPTCVVLFLPGQTRRPGAVITKGGAFYKEYDASTSSTAKKVQIKKDGNGRKPHFNLHVEGVESLVRYKGPVYRIVEQLCAGIRSGLSYSGAFNIKEFHKKARFIRITPAGLKRELSP